MKVCFGSEESKTSVLKNCRFLKGKENYRDANISRYIIFLEREERKTLVAEMKRKQTKADEAGKSEKWIIVKNKVIKGRVLLAAR